MQILSILLLLTLQKDAFDETMLYGRWKWVETHGGMTDSQLDAVKRQEDRSILFTIDHAIFYFSKDSVTYKNMYFCYTGKGIFSETNQVILEIKGTSKKQIVNLKRDTLTLRENSFDGFTHIYAKMK